jgi:integrase
VRAFPWAFNDIVGDDPLPKFLDDPTAAKFMATLAADPDRRRRLPVEPLARTGMRAGELSGLRDDTMYRVGDTWWLRNPIGKLHNDRNVSLHPLLVGLITDCQAGRGPSRNGYLLERDDAQPFDRRTIHRYVAAVARRAGEGRGHPHQLRHTLATQCQPREEPRSQRRSAGTPLTTHDPGLRPHLRH